MWFQNNTRSSLILNYLNAFNPLRARIIGWKQRRRWVICNGTVSVFWTSWSACKCTEALVYIPIFFSNYAIMSHWHWSNLEAVRKIIWLKDHFGHSIMSLVFWILYLSLSLCVLCSKSLTQSVCSTDIDLCFCFSEENGLNTGSNLDRQQTFVV